MFSVSPGSANSARLIREGRLPQVAADPTAQQGSRARRWLVAGVRSLHEKPLIFPLMVNIFRALQYLGISVTPNHFYWPVPDVAELEKRDWCKYPLPAGMSLHDQDQLGKE